MINLVLRMAYDALMLFMLISLSSACKDLGWRAVPFELRLLVYRMVPCLLVFWPS